MEQQDTATKVTNMVAISEKQLPLVRQLHPEVSPLADLQDLYKSVDMVRSQATAMKDIITVDSQRLLSLRQLHQEVVRTGEASLDK